MLCLRLIEPNWSLIALPQLEPTQIRPLPFFQLLEVENPHFRLASQEVLQLDGRCPDSLVWNKAVAYLTGLGLVNTLNVS